MRELSEQLYLTRREFLKAVGVGAVAVSTGCVYRPKETPAPKKRFTPELRIEGDEEFKRNVERMLGVLREYSPEWYEKTMYAGEVIRSGSPSPTGGEDGTITLSPNLSKLRYDVEKNVTRILLGNETLVHEVQHIIDGNTYWVGREDIPLIESGIRTGLESELRAGFADAVYRIEISKKVPEYYEAYKKFNAKTVEENFYMWRLERFEEDKRKVDQITYKDRLDKIEQMYFDHANKKLKTDFLDESWLQFKRL